MYQPFFVSCKLYDSIGGRNVYHRNCGTTDALSLLSCHCLLCFSSMLPESERQWPIMGLNLVYLLANNRIGEFHTELEAIPVKQHTNQYIEVYFSFFLIALSAVCECLLPVCCWRFRSTHSMMCRFYSLSVLIRKCSTLAYSFVRGTEFLAVQVQP